MSCKSAIPDSIAAMDAYCKHLQKFFLQYGELEDQFKANLMKGDPAQAKYWSQNSPKLPTDPRCDAKDHYMDVTNKIFAFAVKTFTQGTVPIQIDMDKIPGYLFPNYNNNNYADFSPIRLWEYLEGKFGGEKGVIKSYEEAANALVNLFRFDSNPEIKERKGSVSIYVRAFARDGYRGKRYYSYSYGYKSDPEFCGKYLTTWGEYLCAQGQDFLPKDRIAQLLEVISDWGRYSPGLIPGDGFEASPHLTVIPRLHNIEYKLSLALANSLREFIGLYRTHENLAEAS